MALHVRTWGVDSHSLFSWKLAALAEAMEHEAPRIASNLGVK